MGITANQDPTTKNKVDPEIAERVALALFGSNFHWEKYEANSTVGKFLLNYSYCSYIPTQFRTGAYRNPAIVDVIKTFFTSTKHVSPHVHPMSFSASFHPMPERVIAFALTAVCAYYQTF